MYCRHAARAAVASALFIAPTAYHRMMFRRGDKPHLVFASNKWALVGLVALAVAMNGAVLLVTDFLFETWVATTVVTATAALYIGLWFVWPLLRRLPHRENG